MSYRSPYGSSRFDFADWLTPGVRNLIVANGVVFLLQVGIDGEQLERAFGLVPNAVFGQARLWQLGTYMFLHGGPFHLLFNMFALFMFGTEIEREWGTREFYKFFFFTGVGAGLTHWVMSMSSPIPTIGASGAVFGILLAFGMMFPDRPILLAFILPIPAKYFVIVFGFIELVMVAGGAQDGVARFAHLGGLLFGFIYLRGERYAGPLQDWLQLRKKKIQTRVGSESRKKDAADREAIDAILDKISREGMGSLTPEERRILEEAGRRGRAGRDN